MSSPGKNGTKKGRNLSRRINVRLKSEPPLLKRKSKIRNDILQVRFGSESYYKLRIRGVKRIYLDFPMSYKLRV